MIVGGFVLNLYCDVPGCLEHKRVGDPDSKRAALKGARASGWSINTNTGYVRCPDHKHHRRYTTNAEARES